MSDAVSSVIFNLGVVKFRWRKLSANAAKALIKMRVSQGEKASIVTCVQDKPPALKHTSCSCAIAIKSNCLIHFMDFFF